MEIHIAVMYLGASFCPTMKLPAIPPAPLPADIAAAVNARFHCLSCVSYQDVTADASF